VRRARHEAAGPARRDNVKSLPASQRRALNQIEKALADDHPSLGPLFAIFTRLTGHETMPVTEQVTARRWRWQRWKWMRPGVAAVVGLAMATGALLALSLMVPGPQLCAQAAVIPVAAHTRFPAGRQPVCAPQQKKLTTTSPSRP
jgi:hypothetical protein